MTDSSNDAPQSDADDTPVALRALSLTKDEAEARARLLWVERYQVDIDFREIPGDGPLRTVSTITFGCREPGASTFVDAAFDVESATLNGDAIAPDAIADGRIRVDGLADSNVLVVTGAQPSTGDGEWVHRSVDASDGEVYVWMTFEPDDARKAWACFDQPDLKAPHGIVAIAPAGWTVVSNSDVGTVVDHEDGESRTWTFPDTPPLSTYVAVVNAGPWHEIRSQRGGHDLGLLTRRSLAQFLDRDAEELFEVTAQGLAFFGERFGLPFPQRSYDQIFVPDMGGAMENYGCVTWGDGVIFRNEPTHTERENRALILLHEMAHMWFGDIVTMRWWEDLWLNEAFAEWACHWAAVGATRFTDAWAGMLATEKLDGYAADMAPTTHPIRMPVENVAAAMANFDAITYPKGASVLKQLHALLGEDAFVAGLRAYFAEFAWGNTELEDLTHALGKAAGRDLADWTVGWLDRSGTDRLTLETDDDGGLVLTVTAPDGGDPRPHSLAIGAYTRNDPDEDWTRQALVQVETTGARTPIEGLAEVPADLLLVNDEDLTFASVRPQPQHTRALLEAAARLPEATGRAVAVTTSWDMLMNGEIAAPAFVESILAVLRTETVEAVVEPYLFLAERAASEWSSDADMRSLMSDVADVSLLLTRSDVHRHAALRTLSSMAVTDEQLSRLRELAGDDVDLRWRILVEQSARGEDVAAADVAALQEADPDPDAWVRALAVATARPAAAAKQPAWDAVFVDHRIPMAGLREIRRAFWRRDQGELLAPFAEQFLDQLPTLDRRGMIPAIATTYSMYPGAGVDLAWADRAEAAALADGVGAIVTRCVRETTDYLRRVLRARAL